ncbi:hypothetical protein JF540_16675 [Salipiger thiooxidans]|uniref:hypothetical protein n=1 Tax=Salipiger thiooxidans TaxID=282683 RepID=UPI001A8E26E3|nr:hypothetical protein [Salipiger thiooxidans]MBN8188328.1 hypothetical protein [Salipiger thiooxidans]
MHWQIIGPVDGAFEAISDWFLDGAIDGCVEVPGRSERSLELTPARSCRDSPRPGSSARATARHADAPPDGRLNRISSAIAPCLDRAGNAYALPCLVPAIALAFPTDTHRIHNSQQMKGLANLSETLALRGPES